MALNPDMGRPAFVSLQKQIRNSATPSLIETVLGRRTPWRAICDGLKMFGCDARLKRRSELQQRRRLRPFRNGATTRTYGRVFRRGESDLSNPRSNARRSRMT